MNRQHEPERDLEREARDPAGRTKVTFVDGPTGPAPLATEFRGDPGHDEADRTAEGSAAGGALTGTALAGPLGGVVGGVVGATIGSAAEATTNADEGASDDRDSSETLSDQRVANTDR